MHWSEVSCRGTGPIALKSHTVSVIGRKIYLIGGFDNKEVFNTDLFVLDTDIGYWYKPAVNDGPTKIRAHTATTVGEKIFVFGGGTVGTMNFKDVWVFDTSSCTWSKPLATGQIPSARRAHTANLIDNKIYFFGGYDGSESLNDTYILDVETYKWTYIEPQGELPPKRGYHKTVVVNRSIYVFGGSDGKNTFEDLYIFDSTTNKWAKSTTLGLGLLATAPILLGNYIIAFGGHSEEYTNILQILDLREMQWTTPTMSGIKPPQRAYHTICLCDHRLWIIGGGDDTKCFNDVRILDLGTFASQEFHPHMLHNNNNMNMVHSGSNNSIHHSSFNHSNSSSSVSLSSSPSEPGSPNRPPLKPGAQPPRGGSATSFKTIRGSIGSHGKI
eukprot:TRINITY_DN6225_c0_g1_i4.p1 TRINITY_DN6225_c0_g1~~TRINITY_DN6225_c0_g1_i4.p1  ORF type:complete len:385 (+),score=78.28 TRINITY_DN6225_c0_g1_i4:180-1334(+)